MERAHATVATNASFFALLVEPIWSFNQVQWYYTIVRKRPENNTNVRVFLFWKVAS
ncbi:hypothetical protein YC2023_090055 [Brassica napus]